MLQLSNIFYDRQILSLRTGGPVGKAHSPLINPNNLKIEGWYATARGEKQLSIVPVAEMRDIISKGIVVDDHSSLTPTEDLVRLKPIIELGFEVIGKQVIDEDKRRVGKVADYAVDNESMYIKKLYVNQSITRSFSTQQKVIDRTQIIEINNRYIMVRDGRVRSAKLQKVGQPA